MRRKTAALLFVMLLMLLLPRAVYANGPTPSPWLEFQVTEAPAGTAYVDLLIPLGETDSAYTALAAELPEGFSETAAIITWHEDGYCSYTFHYEGAESQIDWNPHSRTVTFENAEEIRALGEVRLTMLDESGEILALSPLLDLEAEGLFSYALGGYSYNADTQALEVESTFSTLSALFYIVISACGLAATCLVEWLIAVALRLNWRYDRLVVGTNIVSQVLMRTLFVVLYGAVFRRYAYAVLVLELLVYLGEFLFYRKKMSDISLSKCIMYTIMANTASLLVGLGVNWWLF